MKLNVGLIVQARMGSSRFPGKVLRKLHDVPVVELIFRRASKSKLVAEVVFAIPLGADDDALAIYLQNVGAKVFRGDPLDVQNRFIECAKEFNFDAVVRITGDCPLIDPRIIDDVIALFVESGSDYASNVSPPTMPDGLDVEVFSVSALVAARQNYDSERGREHVTLALRESGEFTRANLQHDPDLSALRWTVDYEDDLESIEAQLSAQQLDLGFEQLLHEGFLGVKSSGRKRNEGEIMGEGQKLWARAKNVIPGGGMLLSKRSEMFLPDGWPSYYSRAKGIKVWDLDGRELVDFSMMSVGACSLGYGDEIVDQAVMAAVSDGVMSSLNSPAEVQLAEELIEMHPWSGMARFARSGGEANAIAIRIARAFTGKDKVAICGYHGWHDWYLSANLAQDSNLDGHLLPGLDPSGVPRSLEGSSVPFAYNDIEDLESLLKTGEFAAVKMEVTRNFGPSKGFLEGVRSICDKYGTVLIFDECTSGFRETFGGIHKKFGVAPDMAMFGKALGNGYAITAVLGSKRVMQAAQSSFISSTFWTERIGPVAALATLGRMEATRSWEILPRIGSSVKQVWSEVLTGLKLPFAISGLDPLASFAIDLPNWPYLKTLFTQEMLDLGYLASASFYASTAHSESDISNYRDAFSSSMKFVADNVDSDESSGLLRGSVAHTGFRRLN